MCRKVCTFCGGHGDIASVHFNTVDGGGICRDCWEKWLAKPLKRRKDRPHGPCCLDFPMAKNESIGCNCPYACSWSECIEREPLESMAQTPEASGQFYTELAKVMNELANLPERIALCKVKGLKSPFKLLVNQDLQPEVPHDGQEPEGE